MSIAETRRRWPGPVRSPATPTSNDSPKLPAGLECNAKLAAKPVGGELGLLDMDDCRLRVPDGDFLLTLGVCSREVGGLEAPLPVLLILGGSEACLSSGSGRSRLIFDVSWRFEGGLVGLWHATGRNTEREAVNPIRTAFTFFGGNYLQLV